MIKTESDSDEGIGVKASCIPEHEKRKKWSFPTKVTSVVRLSKTGGMPICVQMKGMAWQGIREWL